MKEEWCEVRGGVCTLEIMLQSEADKYQEIEITHTRGLNSFTLYHEVKTEFRIQRIGGQKNWRLGSDLAHAVVPLD